MNDAKETPAASRSVKLPWLRYLKLSGLLVLCYVVTYTSLSLCGSYYWTISGKVRLYGWGLRDNLEWSPAGCEYTNYIAIGGEQRKRKNLLGILFAPMIVIDRRLMHPSKPFEIGEGTTIISQ